MPKSVDNLQFLICSNCQGLGYVANKKCNVCHGKKVIAYLDDYILFWGKSINSRFLKLYKLERQIRQSVILILLIFLFLGLFSLSYSAYLLGFYIGDGCLSDNSICLSEHREKVDTLLHRLKKDLEPLGNLHVYYNLRKEEDKKTTYIS